MQLNTHFNQLAGGPLALHKRQIYPVRTPVEAVEFGHRTPRNRSASLFSAYLNTTRWFARGPFREERIAVGGGTVYAQSGARYRPLAFDARDGTREWASDATEGVLGPLAVTDGVLVTLDEDGQLYGLDTETGEGLWSMGVNDNVPGSLAVADGVVYVNEPQGPLSALTA